MKRDILEWLDDNPMPPGVPLVFMIFPNKEKRKSFYKMMEQDTFHYHKKIRDDNGNDNPIQTSIF